MRSTLRLVFILAGALVSICFLAFGLLLAYESVDKEDKFFVRDAAVLDPLYLISLESWTQRVSDLHEPTGVAAHRLKPASGAVFGYRFFSSGDVLTVDDERYKKLTVWYSGGIPKSLEEITLGDTTRALVIYSRGGSAWPESGCSGFVNSGLLRIDNNGARATIGVVGVFEPRGNRYESSSCKAEHLEFTFEASEVQFAQLTPWLGREGMHPYNETYRH